MFIYILFIHFSQAAQLLCTHQWAVKLDSDEEATNLALKYGMANLGLIVDSYYLIEAPILIERDATNIHDSKLVKREWNGVPASHIFPRTFKEVEETLGTLDFIAQVPRERKKRNIVKESPTDLTYFDDPLYSKQWHLYNNGDNGNIAGNDINVAPVWKQGINGSGVIVSVIDDGVDFTHPDLADSWSRNSSFDFTTRNANPAPKDITDTHGTRCAGEIGARPNQGVAYGAGIAGERLVAESTTDAVEAQAFTFKNQINDIYSASWGPSDDGTSVDGPGNLGKRALLQGVTSGRDGLGSIFVFASGNGGQERDNCNFDGYANSIHTVSVGAITWSGKIPWYGEECAAHLAVVYSGGEGLSISTTDVNQSCTSQHSGTSAAAPLAAGLIALVLSARPELGWRDIQQIIVETAQMTDEKDGDWVKNGAGRMVSHKYGFGKMDGEKLVKQGLVHSILPSPALKFTFNNQAKETMDYNTENGYKSDISIMEDQVGEIGLARLEHVQVTVSITHPERSHLRIILVSPAGTHSVLAANRPKDGSSAGYNPWTFMTVRNWGENPAGRWSLFVEDGRYNRKDANGNKFAAGYLASWKLDLHGTCSSDDIVDTSKDTTGRKSLTCVHTIKTSERVQKDLIIGFVVFITGSVFSLVAYGVYRNRLHKPTDRYFKIQDDAESPEYNPETENFALKNLRRYTDLESPGPDADSPLLSTAQDGMRNTRMQSYDLESPSLSSAEDQRTRNCGLESPLRHNGDICGHESGKETSYVASKRAAASSIKTPTSILPSSISSIKNAGGPMQRSSSAAKLNLAIEDTNISETQQLRKSASLMMLAVDSDSIDRARRTGDMNKKGGAIKISRSQDMINEKKD